jgi:hypothetical protein
MRVGSLARDQPIPSGSETLRRGNPGRSRLGAVNLERGGVVKAAPFQRGREPWRGRIPRELCAWRRSKPPVPRWRILVWSKALKARVWYGTVALYGCVFACGGMVCGSWLASIQRQEGIGVGDGVRLRERKKALKGKPQERIWSEIVASRLGSWEASRG